MKRSAVYVRVSTLHQAEKGYSREWQLDNLPKLARANGGICTENDIFEEVMSGSRDDRPEYNKLMALVMEGYYQEVWVVEKSRLSRTEDRSEEQRIVDALQKFGCVIRTPGTTFDVSTVEGEFFNDIDSAVNRMERKRIKQRMQNGKAEKVRQGGYTGGNPPTGYRWAGRDAVTGKMKFEIDHEAAEMVRLAFNLALEGKSLKGIERYLYAHGYRNSEGNKIYADCIGRWLRNPHYAGYTRSQAKGILVEENNFLEPIISKELFRQVQAILDRRSIVRDKRVTHPLSGILTCGNCGRGMRVDQFGGGRKVYICPSKFLGDSCKGDNPKSIYYHVAHQMVIDFVPVVLDAMQEGGAIDREMRKRSTQPQTDKRRTLEARERECRKKINTLLRQQEIRFSEAREKRLAELEDELKLTEQELKKPAQPAFDVVGIRALIAKLTPDKTEHLKTLVSCLFEKIFFKKCGHYHSQKFEITRVVLLDGTLFKVHDNGRLYS